MVHAQDGEEGHDRIHGHAGEAVGKAADAGEVGRGGFVCTLVEAADLADVMKAVLWVGWVQVIDECGEHAETIIDVGGIVEELMAFGGREGSKHVGEDAATLLFRAGDGGGPDRHVGEEGVAFVVLDSGEKKRDG